MNDLCDHWYFERWLFILGKKMYAPHIHTLHLGMDYIFRFLRLENYFLLFIEITYVQKMVPYRHMLVTFNFLFSVTLTEKTKSTLLKRRGQGKSLSIFQFFGVLLVMILNFHCD